MKKKINLICVSKISPIFKGAQDYYINKLKYFCDISIKEVSQSNKLTESRKILKNLPKSSFIIVLDENGKMLSSVEFAKKLIEPYKNISFIIGGPEGLENFVKEKANFLLSLSKMTFQHDIARIVLLEQIFRAFNILKNTPYHK